MVKKKYAVSADGIKNDGVSFYPATPEQLHSFRDASEALSRRDSPILAHANNPHERIFMAAFDGTGNDADKDPEHATNVAKIRDQVKLRYEAGDKQAFVEYIAGPGTQDNRLARIWDGARGHTYEPRIERMYARLVEEANQWKSADPDVQIRVQSIGFSRGASQAAGFTRLLHERGIVDLDSAVKVQGENGQRLIKYTDHLVPPGQTPQTVGLFDPVATGAPMDYDRRLPPSVVSGFQITMADERRATFVSDRIIPLGASEDGRFLNVAVAGAHSDGGGGYHRDGLSVRCCNLMVDNLNAQRDTPFLEKYYEPTDPRFAVVHRSEEGMLFYKVDRKVNRLEPGGFNERQQPVLAPDAAPLPHRAEAVDPALMEGLDRRLVAVRDMPSVPKIPLPPLPDAEFAAASRGYEAAGVAKVLGAIGAATLLYDSATTSERVSELRQQNNETGAQSNIRHFGGRNLGALGGAVLGAQLFATAGAETGPVDLLIGGAGAIGGAFAGEKLAAMYDQHQIYNQTDPQGITWQLDPENEKQGWTRDRPPLPDTPQGQHFTADPALADRLTFQANNKATELAMAYAPKPADPYAQPASPEDAPSIREAPWTRDAQTRAWSRHVSDQMLEHGLTRSHNETATPARAGQLDQAAEQTVAQNVAHSPRAMAQEYQASYAQRGWQRFGPVSGAVATALDAPANALQASDGHDYTRETNGAWTTPGMIYGNNPADAHVSQQLDATLQAQQTRTAAWDARQLAQHAAPAQQSPAAPPPEREPSPAFLKAMQTMDTIIQAMDSGDYRALHKAVQPYVQSAEGKAFFAKGREAVAREDALAKPPARDPRDAGHPDHALHNNIRQQLTTLHTQAGIYPARNLIEPLTAAVALTAREGRLSQVDKLQFNADKTNVIATQGHYGVINDIFAQHSFTPVQQALQTPPEQSYQQMTQVIQQQAQTDQAMQQQMAQSQQQGQAMGR